MPRAHKAVVQVVGAVTLSLALVGCGGAARVVEKPVMVERQRLIVPELQPVDQVNIEWVVLTKDNFEAKVREAEESGTQFVVFALTPQGYQNLSINVAEMRRFVVQQNAVLAAYKKYYDTPQEPPKQPAPEDKPFWKIW